MTTLLSIRDLSSYYGASRALSGLSLDVARGEQIALIGRNEIGRAHV